MPVGMLHVFCNAYSKFYSKNVSVQLLKVVARVIYLPKLAASKSVEHLSVTPKNLPCPRKKSESEHHGVCMVRHHTLYFL